MFFLVVCLSVFLAEDHFVVASVRNPDSASPLDDRAGHRVSNDAAKLETRRPQSSSPGAQADEILQKVFPDLSERESYTLTALRKSRPGKGKRRKKSQKLIAYFLTFCLLSILPLNRIAVAGGSSFGHCRRLLRFLTFVWTSLAEYVALA